MWGFFGSIVVGWMQMRRIGKEADRLFKAGAGLFLSCHISFWFTWSAVGGGMLANGNDPWVSLVGGFFAACGAMALAALAVYRRHPELFGNAPIAIPQEVIEQLQTEQGFTTITPSQTKEKR